MIGPIAVLLVLLLPGGPVLARSPAADISMERMLKSRKLMPEPLRQIMETREQILRDGFAGSPPGADPAQIRWELLQELERLDTLLAGSRSLDEIIFHFGRLARLVCAYTDWAAYAPEPQDTPYIHDFNFYIQRKQARFVAVFYDYSPRLFEAGDLAAYLDEMSRQAASFTEQVLALYRQGGHSELFDDRSPAFGLAARHYSHTITQIANIWLYCWRNGNGDMTGVPFYPYPLTRVPAKGESHE
jgi:hypothetical protein